MCFKRVKRILCVVVVCSFVFMNCVYASTDALRPQMSFVKDDTGEAESFYVLSLNCGSSSVKADLIDPESGKSILEKAINITIAKKQDKTEMAQEYTRAIESILEALPKVPMAIGHRIVHGGEKFSASVLIDKEVLKGIEECSNLALLHNPFNLLGIKACLEHEKLKKLPMVAVFDTAFHRSIPEEGYLYAVPKDLLTENNVRRFGFHGINYRYVYEKAASILSKYCLMSKKSFNIIIFHLGSGCSAVAIKNGKSVRTTMGLTPLEGLIMSTRAGDLDAGIVFHLYRDGMSMETIEHLLNKQSGLKGLSGLSDDMIKLLEAEEQGNDAAKMAIDMFINRVMDYIYRYTGVLGNVDAIILTGGIGSGRDKTTGRLNKVSQRIKNRAMYYFNTRHKQKTPVKFLTIPANEELVIAEDTFAIIQRYQAEKKDGLFDFISINNQDALRSL